MLDAHNARRARHCAPPLRWSNELAQSAQRWANQLAKGRCALRHSDTHFGENLAAGSRGALPAEAVVDLWYGEHKHYRFGRGGFSSKTGHFTQLAWRSTRTLGCAMSECRGFDVWVCHYDPPGNVDGLYRDEVLATKCRKP